MQNITTEVKPSRLNCSSFKKNMIDIRFVKTGRSTENMDLNLSIVAKKEMTIISATCGHHSLSPLTHNQREDNS